ncbi:hypothetical protein PG987_012433 [Apiospora arundinis]
MAAQHRQHQGGISQGMAGQQQEARVGFTVQVSYMLAAIRDDIPENWDNWRHGQLPPPLMYPTATFKDEDVGRVFATNYIGALIVQAVAAYSQDPQAAGGGGWRIDVADDERVSPPERLRCSIPAGNRWLMVRLTSPVMWADNTANFRYLRHVFGSLAEALDLQTPEGCGMTVSVGVAPRAFSLPELRKLAAGFLVTEPLLATLPCRTPEFVSNTTEIQGEKLDESYGHVKDAPEITHNSNPPLHSQLFNYHRVIYRDALQRRQPPPTLPLRTTFDRLMAASSPEEVRSLVVSSLPDPPAYDLSETVFACKQLPATTDADSVAVWCALVTGLARLFLAESEQGHQTLLNICEFAQENPGHFDVFDVLQTTNLSSIAESIQRRMIEKANLLPWANPPSRGL